MYNNKYFKYNKKYNLFKNLYGGYKVGDKTTDEDGYTYEIYKIEGNNFFLIINDKKVEEIHSKDLIDYIFQEPAEVIASEAENLHAEHVSPSLPAHMSPVQMQEQIIEKARTEIIDKISKYKNKESYSKQNILYVENILNIIEKIQKKRLYPNTIKDKLIDLYIKLADKKLEIFNDKENQLISINKCRIINYRIYLYYKFFKLFTITKKKLRELSQVQVTTIEKKIEEEIKNKINFHFV